MKHAYILHLPQLGRSGILNAYSDEQEAHRFALQQNIGDHSVSQVVDSTGLEGDARLDAPCYLMLAKDGTPFSELVVAPPLSGLHTRVQLDPYLEQLRSGAKVWLAAKESAEIRVQPAYTRAGMDERVRHQGVVWHIGASMHTLVFSRDARGARTLAETLFTEYEIAYEPQGKVIRL